MTLIVAWANVFSLKPVMSLLVCFATVQCCCHEFELNGSPLIFIITKDTLNNLTDPTPRLTILLLNNVILKVF